VLSELTDDQHRRYALGQAARCENLIYELLDVVAGGDRRRYLVV
jgi:hypothetical protein